MATYQWLDTVNGRVFRVTNPVTKESVDVPFTRGLEIVSGNMAHGAKSNDERLVAKVVCDKAGNIDAIRKWLDGRGRSVVIAEYEARIRELEQKLAAAS